MVVLVSCEIEPAMARHAKDQREKKKDTFSIASCSLRSVKL
jgi:hypothetical protein